jgi:hypothetical protein
VREQVLAAEWDLNPATLRNWRSQRIGPPYVKINGAIRYSRRACMAWLAAQQRDPADGARLA